jgi:hypothetical protein
MDVPEDVSAPTWRKSTRCATSTCVEVAKVAGVVLVRDSKDPGAVLRFSESDWTGFLDRIVADGPRA